MRFFFLRHLRDIFLHSARRDKFLFVEFARFSFNQSIEILMTLSRSIRAEQFSADRNVFHASHFLVYNELQKSPWETSLHFQREGREEGKEETHRHPRSFNLALDEKQQHQELELCIRQTRSRAPGY